MYGSLLQVAIASFGTAFLLTPAIGRLARGLGVVDQPDGDRKFHNRAIPLVGGAVLTASLLSVFLLVTVWGFPQFSEVLPLGVGIVVIVLVGTLDDRYAIKSQQKLLGQCLAVACVIGGGFQFSGLSLLGFPLELGLLEIPVLAFLLLASINAFNFLDGADAFAASIGFVTSLTLCCLAIHSGHMLDAILAAGLAGSLLGFMAFNFPPARMFLGDSGSMLIGLLVGVLVLRVGVPHGEPVPVGIALALLALPFADVFAAIVRRVLTGRSVAAGDRAHLHHCLSRRGFGPKRIVVAAGLLACIPMLGVAAFAVTQKYYAGWLGLLALCTVLVGSRAFGGNELKLIFNKLFGFIRPWLNRESADSSKSRERQIRIGLQRSEECAKLWNALTAFAEEYGLSRVRLHLSGSWMEDGFDVLWESVSPSSSADNWSTKVPIYSAGRLFGNVQLSGTVIGSSGQHILAPLGDLIDANVPRIDQLFYDVARRAVAEQLGDENRVLFINRSYWPDCEATGQLLTDLCEDLATEFDVSVLVGQPNHVTHKQSFRTNGAQHRNNVDIYRIPHTTFSKGSMVGKALNLVSFTLSAMWKVFWVPKHEVVVVETDPFLLAIVGALVKKLRGCKLVVYMQDVYPDVATEIGKVRRGWITRITGSLMQWACQNADKVIVLGDDMKRRMISHGIDEGKITLIPNWTDTSVVYPVKEQNTFREKQGLGDKFVIMHSGNMGLTQELDVIIEVAAQLNHRDDIEFVFVGNGASRPRLEATAKEKGLRNVRFVPYQPREELAISLSAADLHLVSMHPNITGCLVPSKLYGIMASGTPVLAVVPQDTDVWKVVTSERIGVAVRPGEVGAIKAAIECCVEGEVDLHAMSERARMLAENRYDRRQGSASFAEMLENYVERNPEDIFKRRRREDKHQVPAPHAPAARWPSTVTPYVHIDGESLSDLPENV